MSDTNKIVLKLDPEDSELADRLEEISGSSFMRAERLDGGGGFLVQIIEISAASLNVIAAYLAVRAASPRSHFEDRSGERPLNIETVDDLRDV